MPITEDHAARGRGGEATSPIPSEMIAEWKQRIADGNVLHDPSAHDVILLLLAEREEMLALLREVEWRSPGGDGIGFCPACDGEHPKRDAFGVVVGGHRPDCRVAAFLR